MGGCTVKFIWISHKSVSMGSVGSVTRASLPCYFSVKQEQYPLTSKASKCFPQLECNVIHCDLLLLANGYAFHLKKKIG